MVAVAAYYRALERGFQGGDPVADWLQAEAEIDLMLSSRTTRPEAVATRQANRQTSATKDASASAKASFLRRLDMQLKGWDALFADMKARAAKMKAKTRREYETQLELLGKERAVLEEGLAELRGRSADAWTEMKGGMEKAWQDLRRGMDQIGARFK